MTLPRYLVLGQARLLAMVCLLAWGALVLAGVVGQLFAGVDLQFVLRPGCVAPLAASLLPEAIAVAVPMALALHGILLRENGELVGAVATGVPRIAIQSMLLVPVVPLLLCLSWTVHEVRPAALASLREAVHRGALRSELVWERALQARDVGVARTDAGGWRGLVPLGDGCLALSLDRPPESRGDSFRLGPGRWQLLAAGDAELRRGSFEAAGLALPPWRLSLSERSLRELSSAVLTRGAPRWLASRHDASLRQSAARRIAPELAGRRAIWLGVLLGALLASWPIWAAARRPVWIMHALATVPGIAAGLLLPRLVEAWW